MKYLLLISLLIVSLGYSQSSVDTLYIVFDGKRYQEKIDPTELSTPKVLQPEAVYAFYFDEEKKSFFRFLRARYLNYDSADSNLVTKRRLVKKCFFFKNKNKVLSPDFFTERGIIKSFWDMHGSFLYIVDMTEKKNGRIPIYEVGMYSSYFPQ